LSFWGRPPWNALQNKEEYSSGGKHLIEEVLLTTEKKKEQVDHKTEIASGGRRIH